MMCIGWKNTDSCSGGVDACSVVAMEGGAVITDPSSPNCKPATGGSSNMGLLLALGLGLLLAKGGK